MPPPPEASGNKSMKYFELIWAGLRRKRTRTIFTFLSILAAFLLFGVLQGVNSTFNRLVATGRLDVLLTTNPIGLPIPLAELPQIQKIPGVSAVTYRSGFIGYFQSVTNLVPVFAVDPQDALLTISADSEIPAAELNEFRHTRTGALISARLAQRLHWKIGDHVPVQALNVPKKDGSSVWTFDIVGIYPSQSNAPQQLVLLMNYLYFDAQRVGGKGTVQLYVEKVADTSNATAIANAIDSRFVNSGSPTHTDTERGYLQSSLAEIGDLEFFVDAIVGSAFAMLLLLTGSNMMQSFRERVAEFAVLKSIGFSDGTLATLVLCEAVLLCTGAAATGLLLASMLLQAIGGMSGGDIPSVRLPGVVFLYGVAAAVTIALASALPAAWRTKRLSIVDALTVH
jgi:putative ABC transport system permease protein